MDQLKEAVKDFSDQELLTQYINHKDEYTAEALAILEDEIKARGLRPQAPDKTVASIKRGQINLDTDDFEQFEHTFTRSELTLAVSILRDNDVILYADNPTSVDSIPLETEASKRFTIHVHKDSVQKAHELLDEHFEKKNGEYKSRYSSVKDRLKSFNFHDIRISEEEDRELIDVGFSDAEIEVISKYGKRLLSEVDKVEQEQERVVFFYDSIEPLLDALHGDNAGQLIRSDLLTILEICQIYCDEPDFPDTMDEAVTTLLNFFFDEE